MKTSLIYLLIVNTVDNFGCNDTKIDQSSIIFGIGSTTITELHLIRMIANAT